MNAFLVTVCRGNSSQNRCLDWLSSLKFLIDTKNSLHLSKLSNRTKRFSQKRHATSLINNLLIVNRACYSLRSE